MSALYAHRCCSTGPRYAGTRTHPRCGKAVSCCICLPYVSALYVRLMCLDVCSVCQPPPMWQGGVCSCSCHTERVYCAGFGVTHFTHISHTKFCSQYAQSYHTHTHIHIHTHTHTHTNTHTRTCIHTQTHKHTNTHTNTNTHKHTNTQTHTQTHKHTSTQTHTNTQTH